MKGMISMNESDVETAQSEVLREFDCSSIDELEMKYRALLHDVYRTSVSDPNLKWMYLYADFMSNEIYAYKKASVATNN